MAQPDTTESHGSGADAAYRRLRRVPARGQVLQDGRVGGGLHVCLCAQQLAEEQGVPVSVVLAAKDTVSWLDESARLWGIPRVVGGLMDRCFERLPAREAGRFAVAAIEAIPGGADLDSVGAQWMLKLLADPREGVLRHTLDGSIQHRAVNRVIDLYRRALAGDDPAPAEWTTAAQAAALADASEQADPPACAARTANLAAVAFAHDLVPMQVQIAAIRSAATMPEIDAEAYQTAYIETESLRPGRTLCERDRSGRSRRVVPDHVGAAPAGSRTSTRSGKQPTHPICGTPPPSSRFVMPPTPPPRSARTTTDGAQTSWSTTSLRPARG